MGPDLTLLTASTIAGFMLKTTAAFVLCVLLERLTASPNRRFLIWFIFLTGVGVWWAWLVRSFCFGDALQPMTGRVAALDFSSVPMRQFELRGSHAMLLAAILRGTGIVYGLALLLLCVIGLRMHLRTRRALLHGCAPPRRITELFEEIADSLDLHRCQIVLLPGLSSPAMIGWTRPKILLHSACDQQDRSELHDILLHELMHVKRRDYLWDIAGRMIRAMLVFHPAAWYALKRMRTEREIICDMAVIERRPERRLHYAECLLRFARLRMLEEGGPEESRLGLASRTATLTTRIKLLLMPPEKLNGWAAALHGTVATVLLAIFIFALPMLAVAFHFTTQPWIAPTHTVQLRKSGRSAMSHTRARRKAPSTGKTLDQAMLLNQDSVGTGNRHLDEGQSTERFLPRASNAPVSDSSDEDALGVPPSTSTPANEPSPSWEKPMPNQQASSSRRSLATVLLSGAAQLGRMGHHDHDKDFR